MKSLNLLLGLLINITLSFAAQADTYVVVHGGFGGAHSMKGLGEAIEAAGHKVYRPSLTGLGDRSHLSAPEISLGTHITDIVNIILYEDLHDIVLVGHSYGGMIITGVADRVPDRIARMVYSEGLLPRDGESLVDIHAPTRKRLPQLSRGGFAYHPKYDPDAPPPKPAPQPLKTAIDKISLTGAGIAAQIPTTYILTVRAGTDAAKDDFAPQAERARGYGWKVIQVPGEHNQFRDKPGKFAALIMQTNPSRTGGSTRHFFY